MICPYCNKDSVGLAFCDYCGKDIYHNIKKDNSVVLSQNNNSSIVRYNKKNKAKENNVPLSSIVLLSICLIALAVCTVILFLSPQLHIPHSYTTGSVFILIILLFVIQITILYILYSHCSKIIAFVAIVYSIYLLIIPIILLNVYFDFDGTEMLKAEGIALLPAFGLWSAAYNSYHGKTGLQARQEYSKELKLNEERTIEKELQSAIYNSKSAPWNAKYFTYSCPYCRHYKVRYSTWDDKRMSVAFWGAYSWKIGKRYHCDHCGRDFNN